MKKTASTYDKFLEFRAVIIRAIAAAWQDKRYKESLLHNPKSALKEKFDYDFPFSLDLKADDKNASWAPNLNAGWVVHRENTLKLVLPPKPQNRERHDDRTQVLIEARALAEYNASHLTFLTNSNN